MPLEDLHAKKDRQLTVPVHLRVLQFLDRRGAGIPQHSGELFFPRTLIHEQETYPVLVLPFCAYTILVQ